ncbi:Chymotrypsinogen B [Desmophyllum pertusum]|uniref:Chymotrypsinogen B n=1 Tax=Desmophyllum pertusum TaxID=174260 RepID=A0A9X0CYK0_9CNID|nr:Chymotrypsinogen B [Desmophyllum pertusum]
MLSFTILLVSFLAPTISEGDHICGASLITPEWLVTASHCVGYSPDPKQFKIVLGAHERKNDGEEYDISKVIIHPDFTSWPTLKHDVTLLKLSRPAKLGGKVNTICLPRHGSRVSLGTKCFVTGWGKTRPLINILAQRLKQAEAPLATLDDAGEKTEIRWMTMPWFAWEPRKQRLQWDSGGPLSCLENGRWVLRGAASWVSRLTCPRWSTACMRESARM